MDNIDIAYRILEDSKQRILSLISYGFEVIVSAKHYTIWKINPKDFPKPEDCQLFLNHLRSWVNNGIKNVIKTNPNETSQYLNLISLANQYDKIS
jgi:hypothetical protein